MGEGATSQHRTQPDATFLAGLVDNPPTYVVMLGAVLGAGLGALVLFFDLRWLKLDWQWQWHGNYANVLDSGSFILWASLICAQTTLWALASVPILATLRRHQTGWTKNKKHRVDVVISSLLLAGIVALIVIVPAVIHKIPSVMPNGEGRVRILSLLAFLVTLAACIAIWLIGGRLAELGEGTGKKQLELYIEFRSDLERLLGILGAVVGLAVLSSAALRQVVLKNVTDPNAFPNQFPLLYGLVLSLVLALVYLPTYLGLLTAGADLRNRAAPLLEPDDDSKFEEAVARRATITELLGLDVSASTNFRAGVAILSPLLGALVSLLPKLGG